MQLDSIMQLIAFNRVSPLDPNEACSVPVPAAVAAVAAAEAVKYDTPQGEPYDEVEIEQSDSHTLVGAQLYRSCEVQHC